MAKYGGFKYGANKYGAGAVTAKTLSTTVLCSATIPRQCGKLITGAVSVAGSVLHAITKTLTATTLATGVVVRSTSKRITSLASASATVTRSIGKVIVANTLVDSLFSLTTTAVQIFTKTLTASISAGGVFAKTCSKHIVGAVSASGVFTKMANKVISVTTLTTSSVIKISYKYFTTGVSLQLLVTKAINKALSSITTVFGRTNKRLPNANNNQKISYKSYVTTKIDYDIEI